MKIFDTHCHLNIDPLKKDFLKLNNALKKNKIYANVVATTYMDGLISLKQSSVAENVYSTLGIHPSNIKDHNYEEYFQYLESVLEDYKKNKIVAVGETGLDLFHSNFYKRDEDLRLQKKWFLKHYKLAQKFNLPLVIHVRDAHEELFEILNNEVIWYGIIHCYNQGPAMTRKFLNLPGNWIFGFNGIITYKSARDIYESIRLIPLQKIVVETDSPWLSPQAVRKDVNTPLNIPLMINEIARIKEISVEKVATTIWENSMYIFNLKLDLN